MSNPGGFELFLKFDDRQLKAQLKQWQDMFINVHKQFQKFIPPHMQQQIQQVNAMTSSNEQQQIQEIKKQSDNAKKQVEQVNKQMSIFEKMKEGIDNISKNALALLGIGAGITGMLHLMMEASPILQSTFRLLQHSVIMLIRPIADAVGLFIRPILIELYRKFIIPWHNNIDPIVKNLSFLKELPGIRFPLETLSNLPGIIKDLKDALSQFRTTVDFIKLNFSTAWDSVREWFNRLEADIQSRLGKAWNDVVNFFQGVKNTIDFALGTAWANVVAFFNDLRMAATSTLMTAWNAVKSFFASASESITSTLKPAWDSIKAAGSDIKSALETVWRAIVDAYNNIRNNVPFGGNILPEIPRGSSGSSSSSSSSSSSGSNSSTKIPRGSSGSSSSSSSSSSSGSNSSTFTYKGLTGAAAIAAKAAGFAKGGTLYEHVIGIGASGRVYEFAEHGPEEFGGSGPFSRRGGLDRALVIQGPLLHVEHMNVNNRAEIDMLMREMEARLKRLVGPTLQVGNVRGGNI